MNRDSQDYKDHMAKVRDRQNDPDFFPSAQGRIEKVKARLKVSNANALASMIQDECPPTFKVRLLHLLTDTLGKAMDGISPCRSGCSHCCKMALNITPLEAEAISKATGRPLAPVSEEQFKTLDEDAIRRLEGSPCPFLVDDRCSVYEVRPFACRVHYSMDRDNLLCKIIPGE